MKTKSRTHFFLIFHRFGMSLGLHFGTFGHTFSHHFSRPGKSQIIFPGLLLRRRPWRNRKGEGGTGKHLRGIWEHLGGIWEASRSIGWLGSILSFGGSFTIVKMQSKRHDRPFYRRVAKVGGTKYRKTHGSRADAWRTGCRRIHSPHL